MSEPPELPPHTHRSIAGRNGKKIWFHIMQKAPPFTSIGPGGNTVKEARANAREFLRFHADNHTPEHPMQIDGDNNNDSPRTEPTAMTLKDIGRTGHQVNKQNGWEVFQPEDWSTNGPNVQKLLSHMALTHSEVSEATEAIRHRDKDNFAEEMADVILRVTSIAHGMQIDLDKAISEKLAKNRTRGFKHGGKEI